MPIEKKQSEKIVLVSPKHDNWICPECQRVRSLGIDRIERTAYCCWCTTLFINIEEV